MLLANVLNVEPNDGPPIRITPFIIKDLRIVNK
jgi:hypothetical protein